MKLLLHHLATIICSLLVLRPAFVAGQACSTLDTRDCCIIGTDCALCLTKDKPDKGSTSKSESDDVRVLQQMHGGRHIARGDGGQHHHRNRALSGKGGKGGICGATLTCIDAGSEDELMCEEEGGEVLDCVPDDEQATCPTPAPTVLPTIIP